jgi:hypothetical protein
MGGDDLIQPPILPPQQPSRSDQWPPKSDPEHPGRKPKPGSNEDQVEPLAPQQKPPTPDQWRPKLNRSDRPT